MAVWYDNAVFYHMYPLGMTGAPFENKEEGIVHRFEELKKWLPHVRALGCDAIYIGPLFESTTHGYDTRDYKTVDRRRCVQSHRQRVFCFSRYPAESRELQVLRMV